MEHGIILHLFIIKSIILLYYCFFFFSGLDVPIPSSVSLICQDNTVQVYNVDKEQYDNCQPLTDSNIQIGM